MLSTELLVGLFPSDSLKTIDSRVEFMNRSMVQRLNLSQHYLELSQKSTGSCMMMVFYKRGSKNEPV
jgi:hypothetical protein